MASGVALLTADGRVLPALLLVGLGALGAIVPWRRPEWGGPVQVTLLVLLILLSWILPLRPTWLAPSLGLGVAGVLLLLVLRLEHERRRTERERQQLAQQLDRRINEIFSLQELSYVLAESLQQERIAEQVARYALRFLQAEGAVVALAGDDGQSLRVAAAEGTLSGLQGQLIHEDEQTLVMEAITRERIEVGQRNAEGLVTLLGDRRVESGAAAPLRAHGFTMGALAVADRRSGPFTSEDLWLLSTVTTHVAVVMANSRLFEMVRQAKEEWETAFNALTEGIAVVDDTGRIRRANRSLARLLEAPAPALIGLPFWETVVGPRRAGADLLAAFRQGDRLSPLVIRSETTQRMIRLTAAPLAEPADRAAYVILIEDVTEQQALEAQVIQNEKLAAVGQLVSGVAHELNNPLTSIAGLSEFLFERSAPAGAEREHLRVIHEQAERAGRIVRNLLTFARKGGPETTTVDLNDVVERTTLLIAYELRLRGIELEQHRSADPMTVAGDRYELQQVLLNLLTNAVHAVQEPGASSPRRISIETVREGNLAVIRVRDSGPGIPPHLVPHLFTPFFTTKDPGEGTGLGLSISYGIMESHGGKLAYAPGAQGGSEFSVALPFVAGPAAEPAQDLAPGVTTVPPSSILLVDDDPSVHRTVTALLGREGHRLEAVRSGDHALALARERIYDLVIADQRTMAGSGLFAEALLQIRPEWRSRLLLTTTDEGAAQASRREGYVVIQRPFNLRELRDAATGILRSSASQV